MCNVKSREASLTSENVTKKRRPQPAVVYTEVIPTMTHKSGSQPPGFVAVSTSNVDGQSTETAAKDDAVMYAQVTCSFRNIGRVSYIRIHLCYFCFR